MGAENGFIIKNYDEFQSQVRDVLARLSDPEKVVDLLAQVPHEPIPDYDGRPMEPAKQQALIAETVRMPKVVEAITKVLGPIQAKIGDIAAKLAELGARLVVRISERAPKLVLTIAKVADKVFRFGFGAWAAAMRLLIPAFRVFMMAILSVGSFVISMVIPIVKAVLPLASFVSDPSAKDLYALAGPERQQIIDRIFEAPIYKYAYTEKALRAGNAVPGWHIGPTTRDLPDQVVISTRPFQTVSIQDLMAAHQLALQDLNDRLEFLESQAE